jgi:hypothetical protein
MKRLLFAIILIPLTSFGAFTEFFCRSGGSNLNGGGLSTGAEPSTTAAYTATNGNWSTVTNVYTPTDGSTPASTVNVGDWASIYLDAASVAVFIGRVTVVASGVNGGITISGSARAGTPPATSATGRTIKVGGAWKGPNAAVGWPLNVATAFSSAVDSSSDRPRINLKNDQTYSMTSQIQATGVAGTTIQGYTSTVGDGGKATIDGSTSVASPLAPQSSSAEWVDLIVSTSFASGVSDCLAISGSPAVFTRVVVHGARGAGFSCSSSPSTYIECEAYDCDKSNSASSGGFLVAGAAANFYYCISHDNTGSNASGFFLNGANSNYTVQNCIADTNGGNGLTVGSSASSGSLTISQYDGYNNTGDAIKASGSTVVTNIRNSNFIKNGGKGINVTTNGTGGRIDNNGYGSGTQANGSSDTISSLVDSGTAVTYGSNLTPWVDPANGDFRINLAAANWAGRGAFTQTAASYAGARGYPDIGAAQSKTGPGGTFSKESSYGFSQ